MAARTTRKRSAASKPRTRASRGKSARAPTRARSAAPIPSFDLATLVHELPVASFVLRVKAPDAISFEFVSDISKQVIGLSPAHLRKDANALHPADVDFARYKKEFRDAVLAGRKVAFAGRFMVGKAKEKWLRIVAQPITESRRDRLFCGTIEDIDEAARAREQSQVLLERCNKAQEIANLGWYEFDVAAGTLELTPGFAERLGFDHVPSGRLVGKRALNYVDAFRNALHPDDRDRFSSIIADNKWLRTEFDFRIVTAANEIRHLFIRIHRTADAKGKRLKDFAVLLDITDRKRLEEDLRAQASTDPLTSVANRRTFDASGRRELERARRYNKPFVTILIDIDHFKKVNDTYGHDIGDLVLKEIAKVCAAQLRGTDIFARYGGEEFVALLPETDLKSGIILAERLRQGIALQPIFTPKGPLVVTASLGLATYSAQDKTLDDVVKRADDMLYVAKRNGRNRVEVAKSAGNSRSAAE